MRLPAKKITVIYADDQLDNDLAVLRAAQLVEQDKVDVITGLVSGDEGLTVGDFMRGVKTFLSYPCILHPRI